MSDFDALAPVRLDGALCVGRWDFFDPPDPMLSEEAAAYRQEAALKLCRSCPALADWNKCSRCADDYIGGVASLKPSKRPPGVIAGYVNIPQKPSEKAS